MFRTKNAARTYRPLLLERPSMGRFVLLSFLLHTLLVLLFGDATGAHRDGTGWARSFVATIERVSSRPLTSARSIGVPTEVTTSRAVIAPITATALAEPSTPPEPVPATMSPQIMVEPVNPIEIEKIPAIAVDVPGASSPFSVAPIAIAPIIAAPLPPAAAAPARGVVVPMISAVDIPIVKRDNTDFAMYVAPIVESSNVTISTTVIPATPTLAPLAKPKVDRDFAAYTPPPVVSPSISVSATAAGGRNDTQVSSQEVIVPPPAIPATAGPVAEPASPLKPIEATPIEPLRPAAATAQVERYRPRDTETATSSPNTSTANTEKAATTVPNKASEQAAPIAPGAVPPVESRGMGSSAMVDTPLPQATPAAPPALPLVGSGPRLDLDTLRRQARELANGGTGPRTLMPFPTVAKEAPKKDMEKIFDKALKRPDCNEAYAEYGLAAVVPLVRDAVKEGGCKW